MTAKTINLVDVTYDGDGSSTKTPNQSTASQR